jgi:hypothetical protein
LLRPIPVLIGEYLQRNADVKSVAELESEGTRKTDKLVANLASQIEVKATSLEKTTSLENVMHAQELESKYSEKTTSLENVMEERELIFQRYSDGLLLCFHTLAVYMLCYYGRTT